MFAVIPARNEASRIASAIRNVRLAGATRILVVVNGCHDGTREVVHALQAGDLTMLTFREALGVDVPRAIGAAYAYSRGARHVLFYDGDLIGQHRDELARLVRSAQRFDVDLALTDTYGIAHDAQEARDTLIRLRYELNHKLGLSARLGLSNPAHGPHIVSRRLMREVPLAYFAKPPLLLTSAVQQGLHIDTLAHIAHARLGSAHKGPAHYERIRETIIGDLLEALCLTQDRPPSRELRGLAFDGYNSERRFDLLERFVQSLQKKTPLL
ncbi:glycosyltransferase family 2 protein [Tumebacillus permanentifrigoris]|uniref:Glycosyl transferase family 2 n=1 Tax=Tumebacillus permanentifrigoris TaxID=378543 RepID=A0A316D4T7_9BACL|nr:glycosyltransferase [Tumebacillus permanentifrigoris]PWK07915.1 glycosyl transferase family 2 [Tumebacillus permanentifrigoris]